MNAQLAPLSHAVSRLLTRGEVLVKTASFVVQYSGTLEGLRSSLEILTTEQNVITVEPVENSTNLYTIMISEAPDEAFSKEDSHVDLLHPDNASNWTSKPELVPNGIPGDYFDRDGNINLDI